MDQNTFNRILGIAFEKGVSDIHFEVGYPPLFRARGQLIRSKLEPLTPQSMDFMVKTVLEQSNRSVPDSFTELDSSYSVTGVGRFRVSIFKQRGNYGIVMRAISHQIRSIEELNLPPVLHEIVQAPCGLILVTGPTGNGKSTTLAAMIREVSDKTSSHIVTIEDPVEFLFPPSNSCVVQREVHIDTPDFQTALRTAMRMDPDVIMVGEMRDQETIDASIKAAETGHLVFSTLHTNNATATIMRLISFFASDLQEVMRQRLADILVATVSLRLLRSVQGDSLVPAVEVMRTTAAIQACIREGRLADLVKHIERGKDEYHMQTFDQHLVALCRSNQISLDEALKASQSTDLKRNVMLAE